jgi:hypothetical protein
MLLVDVIIHKREVSEDDNISAQRESKGDTCMNIKTVLWIALFVSLLPLLISFARTFLSTNRFYYGSRTRRFVAKNVGELLVLLASLGFVAFSQLTKNPGSALIAHAFDFFVLFLGVPLGIITYIIDVSAGDAEVSVNGFVKHVLITTTSFALVFAVIFYISLPEYDPRIKDFLFRFALMGMLVGAVSYALHRYVRAHGWPKDIPSNVLGFFAYIGSLLVIVLGWKFVGILLCGILLALIIALVRPSRSLSSRPPVLFRLIFLWLCGFLFVAILVATFRGFFGK